MLADSLWGAVNKTETVSIQDDDLVAISREVAPNNWASYKFNWENLKDYLLLDENDMASDSATKGATQQSIKTYSLNSSIIS